MYAMCRPGLKGRGIVLISTLYPLNTKYQAGNAIVANYTLGAFTLIGQCGPDNWNVLH